MPEKISQKDIFDAITDLRREIMSELKDQRKDIDKLQDFASFTKGAVAVLYIFVGGFSTWIWKRIGI